MPHDPQAYSSTVLTRWQADVAVPAEDFVAVEEPLEIRLSGRSLAVLMRTPGHDRELAAGFLWTEGLIRRREDILDIVFCGPDRGNHGGNIADVLLGPEVKVDWEKLTRHTVASASCGLCGKTTLDAVDRQFPASPERGSDFAFQRELLVSLPAKLRAAQTAFGITGGLHASAFFSHAGELVVLREDVGRHNALDKAIGHGFFGEQLPLRKTLLLLSGRVSFEMMQKARAAGIPMIAALSAPTSLAVEFARRSGQTLIGFLRGDRMNVYAGTLEN